MYLCFPIKSYTAVLERLRLLLGLYPVAKKELAILEDEIRNGFVSLAKPEDVVAGLIHLDLGEDTLDIIRPLMEG